MLDYQYLETTDALILHWRDARPDQVALRDDQRSISFDALEQGTRRLAGYFSALGLRSGDRIAWLGKNSLDYFCLLHTCGRTGVVLVPIGWRLSPAEIEWIAADAGVRAVFLGEGFEEAKSLFSQTASVRHFVTTGDVQQHMAAGPTVEIDPAGPEQAVLQLYTSGTTGHPKGALLSNRCLYGLASRALEPKSAYYAIAADETILIAMPCAHIGGSGLATMSLQAGVVAHILPEFEPAAVLQALHGGGITRLFLVPAALHALLQHPLCPEIDTSKLRYILYGAAPMPLELLRQSLRQFNTGFMQVYGMTETTGTVVMLPPEDHDPNGNARMLSAGKPLPGVEIKIVDEAGKQLPVGEVGEVITRSSNNMLGYWNLPDATKKTMTDDGWVHTGDAGYVDEDGYLYIHDRVKDMIISGGENVYPAEVESAIYGHPDVLEVAVIGVPDKRWGEAVKAVCVPKPGATIDPESVIGWARDKIAGFKVPKSIDVIEALPRNASGKILRKDLRAPYWAGYDRQVN